MVAVVSWRTVAQRWIRPMLAVSAQRAAKRAAVLSRSRGTLTCLPRTHIVEYLILCIYYLLEVRTDDCGGPNSSSCSPFQVLPTKYSALSCLLGNAEKSIASTLEVLRDWPCRTSVSPKAMVSILPGRDICNLASRQQRRPAIAMVGRDLRLSCISSRLASYLRLAITCTCQDPCHVYWANYRSTTECTGSL